MAYEQVQRFVSAKVMKKKTNTAFTLLEALIYVGLVSLILVIVFPLLTRLLIMMSVFGGRSDASQQFDTFTVFIEKEAQKSTDIALFPDSGIIIWKDGSPTIVYQGQQNEIVGNTISGYAWGHQFGGIALSGSNFGVSRFTHTPCLISTSSAVSGYQYEGYAWSPSVGWISFQYPTTSTSTIFGVCEQSDHQVRGYAWNDVVGWISLSCLDTGVCAQTPYYTSMTHNQLSGYAWNDVVGWIRFSENDSSLYLIKSNAQYEPFGNAIVSASMQPFRIGKSLRIHLQARDQSGSQFFATTTIQPWVFK